MSTAVIFGTAEYKNLSAALYITSIKKDETSQKAQVMDENGTVVQIDRYGRELLLQIEATVKGNISALVPGATLTVDNVEYTIDTVSTTKTNTGHHTASITASAPGDAMTPEESSGGAAAGGGSGT